eukprot:3077345-Pleurochrysis_carterae.AAC.1
MQAATARLKIAPLRIKKQICQTCMEGSLHEIIITTRMPEKLACACDACCAFADKGQLDMLLSWNHDILSIR